MTTVAFMIFVLIAAAIAFGFIAAVCFRADEGKSHVGGVESILGAICIFIGIISAMTALVIVLSSSKLEAALIAKKRDEIQRLEQVLKNDNLLLSERFAYEAQLIQTRKDFDRETKHASIEDWNYYRREYGDITAKLEEVDVGGTK